MSEPNVEVLVKLFNECFRESEQTILTPGGEEPIYLPAESSKELAKVVSTQDYFSSALHEISHWCIAGKERRTLTDYGYWYEPDGRSLEQQKEFEKVEIKPQALEWLFTEACGERFRISSDNLDNPTIQPSQTFKQDITEQAKRYISGEIAGRAKVFFYALLNHHFPQGKQLSESDFIVDKL